MPPPFSAVRLREVGDAFAHAISIAAEQGAGTLVYVGRFDLAEFAVVLEPEEPLLKARRVFYAGMAALADALAAHAQPKRPSSSTGRIRFWSIKVSLAAAGSRGRKMSSEDRNAAMVGVRRHDPHGVDDRNEPGLNPLVTALEEEGFTDVMSSHVVESFARHFMVALDSWQESGFGAVAKSYLERLPREQGVRRDIDENGDLLVRRMGKAEVARQKFLPRLDQPAWFDPAAKGPRT